MRRIRLLAGFVVTTSFLLTSCAQHNAGQRYADSGYTPPPPNYADRMPQTIASKSRMIVINPNVHAWAAYSGGQLVKAGAATAGGSWCPDVNRPCKTAPGSFRIQRMGDASCKSSKYPIPKGGAPMPYCMFFNGGKALHGSYEVVEGNVSHGCVRLHVADAEWLRFNFASVGTPVVVKAY